MKAACSLYDPTACYPQTSVPVLHVTLLGGEWSSSAGGLSTINRELAIHLSNHSAVKVSLLVPEGTCKIEEIREAHTYGISVVEAKRRAAFDCLDWLSSPPKDHVMDIVVGHGVRLGRQVQFIRDSPQFPNCKWVQVVHTAPEDLSKYKCYSDPISKSEVKHESEVELCKLADLVATVGPRLNEAYSSYLQRCKTDQDVLCITPGLFQREFEDLVAKQHPNEDGGFKVLLFGRGDDEDFELKGYNIAAKAFTDQRLKNKSYHLIFVGAPGGKQEEVRDKLLLGGIAGAQLTVRKFIQSRDKLKDLLCEADLTIMPSKSEGFGLVALEALSAGLPILVGSKSGFAKALENVPNGYSCIMNSDDPAKWAEAIEGVCVRHQMRLEEVKALKTSYGEKYSWKEQCKALVERMWKIVHGSSENGNKTRNEKPLVEETSRAEKRAHFAAGSQTKSSCKHISVIDTSGQQRRTEEQLRRAEEKLREKDKQLREKDKQVREKDEQLRTTERQLIERDGQLKVKEGELKDLRDEPQDFAVVQNKLSAAEKQLTKCESQSGSPDWVLCRDEVHSDWDQSLGAGSFGQVFKGRYCGCVVAIKKLHFSTLTQKQRDGFEREMKIASRCRHPCLLQFIGATQDKSPLFVTELMETSLQKLLIKRKRENQHLSESEIIVICLDVARALNYLHRRQPPIVHRDVSSANVLLWKQNNQWRGKLGDYGTAKFLQGTMTAHPGAEIYEAPEIHYPSGQTVAIDVFSFGILFCEMCTGDPPEPENREDTVRRVTNTKFGKLILWCIEHDAKMRPSMEEIIENLEQLNPTP